MPDSYDVIVVGGGAGLKLVRPVAQLGYRVAAIEEDKLGGTCLNRGCIPSKMLIHPADVVYHIRSAEKYNFDKPVVPKIHFSDLVHYVSSVVDSESSELSDVINQAPNVDFFHGHARFIDPQTIDINGKRITAPKIILAVGSRPYIPYIEGLEDTPFMTSKEALRLTQQPKTLTIIGGGYIAAELGHYFEALGTKVNFVLRSHFIKAQDADIQQEFIKTFSKRFSVFSDSIPKKVTYHQNEFSVTIDQEGTLQIIKSDALLIATGIIPNTDTLGLEKTHIKLDEKGFILVNDRLETSQNGIYAFGDVIGRYYFRHTANFEGEYLFDALFAKPSNAPIQYPPVPFAVFTMPQIAGVGKNEAQLQQEGIEFVVGLNRYKASAMGMALRNDEGLVKLLFDKNNQKLLGAHIIGEEAATMIHMLIAYMKMEATLDDILSTIFVHPALCEIIRNAARKAKQFFNK